MPHQQLSAYHDLKVVLANSVSNLSQISTFSNSNKYNNILSPSLIDNIDQSFQNGHLQCLCISQHHGALQKSRSSLQQIKASRQQQPLHLSIHQVHQTRQRKNVCVDIYVLWVPYLQSPVHNYLHALRPSISTKSHSQSSLSYIKNVT